MDTDTTDGPMLYSRIERGRLREGLHVSRDVLTTQRWYEEDDGFGEGMRTGKVLHVLELL
jgi:hypothetical protein